MRLDLMLPRRSDQIAYEKALAEYFVTQRNFSLKNVCIALGWSKDKLRGLLGREKGKRL